MDSLTLRKATPHDSEFAYQVKKLAFKPYVDQVWGWNEEEQRQWHERRFASQDFQVIQVAGNDVGIVAWVQQPGSIKGNQFFLLPAYQNRGIGTTCMRRILDDADASGRSVQLQVLKINSRAIAFYQRLGFTHIGESDTHLLLECSYDTNISEM